MAKEIVLTVHPSGVVLMPALQTGIHPIIIAMGEIPIVYFAGDSGRPAKNAELFCKVEDVADWHEREAEHQEPKRAAESREVAKRLREAKERLGSGQDHANHT